MAVPFIVSAPSQLGQTLRGFRRVSKLTQAALAKRSGLRQKTVSLLETEPHRCSVDSYYRYLNGLGIINSLDMPARHDTTACADQHSPNDQAGDKGAW
ncbi:MAG: helix-turn-helix domain-containing protein [Burkholderiaceae bacterium]